MAPLRIVISGAGAAGVACANILLAAGVADITVLDSKGIVHAGPRRPQPFKAELAERTNPGGRTGGIAEALEGADVFMGVSAGLVPEELIATMAPNGIVFAMSNPDPEIHPDDRQEVRGRGGHRVAATSRTRSTTCWRSRVCSAVRWTPVRGGSPSG